jgi:hypothetical protein
LALVLLGARHHSICRTTRIKEGLAQQQFTTIHPWGLHCMAYHYNDQNNIFISTIKKKEAICIRLPVISGRELIGTGPDKLKQNFSQSKLLKNSKKRSNTCMCTNGK